MARCGEPVIISLAEFTACAVSRSAARFGVKQVAVLGFVQITAGARRVNTFSRCDGWRAHDADAAARLVTLARGPMPQRASSKPVVPKDAVSAPIGAVPPKPAAVERPRTIQRQVPSLPRLRCLEAGDSA
jgi:hypothetical protein